MIHEAVSQRWGLLRVIADAIGWLSSSTDRGGIMTSFQIIAIILSMAALGSYLNDRYLKFLASIGQMAFALGASASVLFLEALGVVNFRSASAFLYQIDFSNVLLHGILSFLLFAGALAIEIEELKNVVGSVSTLATVGVIIAIFVTGLLVWYAAALAGVDLPYLYALLFGALVSPTDPIAILAILKEAGLSRTLYVQIGSESLFSDVIGVVAFITVLGLATPARTRQQRRTFHFCWSVRRWAARCWACFWAGSSTACCARSTNTESRSC